MLPDPLHPAVVHFPVVLAFLLPIVAAGALWAIRTGARPMRAWGIPLATAAALSLSAWVAVRIGQAQDERVEPVVGEQALGAHEEGAERFLGLANALLAIAAAGLVRGTVGRSARAVTTLGAVALVVAAARVGHTGGALVYRHGAANAYLRGSPDSTVGLAPSLRDGGLATDASRPPTPRQEPR